MEAAVKRISAPFLTLAICGSTAAAADSDILDELRRGEHFNRESLFNSGPNILADALAGNPSQVAVLGLYFENGERGFPRNTKVANRLYEAAFRSGHWPSALNLARAAEDRGDARKAYRYYAMAFLTDLEREEIYARTQPGYRTTIPGFTHFAYAGMQFLLRTGAISQEDRSVLVQEATDEAISRGFFGDCPETANQQCAEHTDDWGRAECRAEALDSCYLERSRRPQ